MNIVVYRNSYWTFLAKNLKKNENSKIVQHNLISINYI
jgi:hypothetical protein